MNIKPIHLLLVLPLMSGCASIERSTLLGAATFGAVGTGIGLAAEKSAGSALIGLGIGALVGGMMGFAAHKEQEAKRGQFVTPLISKDFKEQVPSISTPEVRRIWIGPKIESNRYIDGHFIYVIDRPAVWGK